MNILMPLPDHDFDPSEAAVTWRALRRAGHQVSFATPNGQRAHADPLMLSGEGLDVWGWLPGLKKLKLLGLLLRAHADARAAYHEMQQDPAFLKPRSYHELQRGDWQALVLPGGHAKRMRPYLESKALQNFVVSCFEEPDADGLPMPVAAICHGVLLAARSVSKATGRSVLYGRKTTALTWALERSAWNSSRFLGRFWEPNYYRTYFEQGAEPKGYWSVESEIKRLLARPEDFMDVPADAKDHLRKTSGLVRDSASDARAAWVVRDGFYLSARWPGDVNTFARQFVLMLAERSALKA